MFFRVRVANDTGTVIPGALSTEDWYAVDSLGRRFGVMGINEVGVGSCGAWNSSALGTGMTQISGRHSGYPSGLWINVQLVELSRAEWVRVVIPRLARVRNAAWQIDIPR
jgi:hypothetical protein